MFGYAVAGYPLIWYWHSIIHHRQSKRIFKKSSSILGEFSKKKDKKSLSNRNSIYLVLYYRFLSKGAVGHLYLALSASHSFLDFGETVEFHPFFAIYFVLHNSYIKILAIYKKKRF